VTYVVNVLLIVVVLVLSPSPPGRLVCDGAAGCVSAAVTGQMVVYKEMTSVVTLPILAGQSVTVAAHEVTV
jgi:hypothetical protein